MKVKWWVCCVPLLFQVLMGFSRPKGVQGFLWLIYLIHSVEMMIFFLMWVNKVIIMLDVSSYKSTSNYILYKDSSKIRRKIYTWRKGHWIECPNLSSQSAAMFASLKMWVMMNWIPWICHICISSMILDIYQGTWIFPLSAWITILLLPSITILLKPAWIASRSPSRHALTSATRIDVSL